MADRSSNTERATPKKRKQARSEGQVPRTGEPIQWAMVLLATLILPGSMARGMSSLEDILVNMARADDPASTGVITGTLTPAISAVAWITGPLLVFSALFAVVGRVAQGGWVFAPKALKPKLQRISPAAGLKRMASPKALWDTTKALLRLGLIIAVSVPVVMGLAGELSTGTRLPFAIALPHVGGRVLELVQIIAATGFILGMADYSFQKWQHERDIRMSKEEVKREAKESEGDPMLRSRVRSVMASMSRNRMLSDVSDASVVVVNPTHVAVALGYGGGNSVPSVLAKGGDKLAARIRERAEESSIPIVESIPLARALYKHVKVGDPVPPPLYEAVAVVLAHVFRLRGPRWRGQVHHVRTQIPDSYRGDPAPAEAEAENTSRLSRN
ncbi:MAG: EscU/YscU/HrcU family type III secretion system export apparatus switch protein [Actinomycetia bacterium]|nr:EscU/YscU/HrcU family type III secretion system export apparatus switch protein [Actinomycetes bacterium]